MITCQFRGGRLGEVMHMIYGLFYFCIQNKIPFDQIVIDKNYKGHAFFSDISESVIVDNFPIFENIQHIFVDNMNDFFKNPKPIDMQFNPYADHITYDPFSNYCLINYWCMPICYSLFRALFKSQNLINCMLKKYKTINFNESLGIHIRRGDFIAIEKDDRLKNIYPNKVPMNKQKILEHINIICKECTWIRNAIVFSDDIEWCKKNIKCENLKFIYMNNAPYEDMTLLSMCKKRILSKGSYFSYCAEFMH